MDADSISNSVDSAIQHDEEEKCLEQNIVEKINEEVQSSGSSINGDEVDEPAFIEVVEPAVIEEVEPVVIETDDDFDGEDFYQNAEIDRLMGTAHECDESDERDMH